MAELDTRDLLRRAVADEPDYTFDLDTVVARGRVVRRRRRVGRGSAAAIGVCAVAGAAFVLAPGLLDGTSTPQTTVTPGSGGSGVNAPSTARPPVVATRPTDPLDAKIAEAIESGSPAGWDLDLASADSTPGGVDGTADDGSGPGRITIGLSTGTQQIHPCKDKEFVAGASCTERTLASGAVLSQRGLAVHDGVGSYLVTLTYPDGSGVNAEAGNYILAPEKAAPGAVITAGSDKPVVTVTRAEPTYDLQQLVTIVGLVDHATS